MFSIDDDDNGCIVAWLVVSIGSAYIALTIYAVTILLDGINNVIVFEQVLMRMGLVVVGYIATPFASLLLAFVVGITLTIVGTILDSASIVLDNVGDVVEKINVAVQEARKKDGK